MKNQAINSNYLEATRRRQKLLSALEHPSQQVPAYVRKNLSPKVQIGILRDPASPIVISPSIHTPEEKEASFSGGWSVLGVCVAAVFFLGFVGA